MMQPDNQPDSQGPVLLSMGRRDTRRLLEVYVKRSLSLNDGSLLRQKDSKFRIVAKGFKHGTSRSSSDGSAHPRRLRLCKVSQVLSTIEASPTEYPAEGSLPSYKDRERSLREKVRKNPSVLKRFLGLFSRKDREEKEGREQGSERTGVCGAQDGLVEASSLHLTPEPLGKGDQDSQWCQKSLGKKRPLLSLSFRNHAPESAQTQRKPSFRIIPGMGQAEAVVCVEPTGTYYEKVSEELERIVKEVKDSPSEEGQQTFAEAIQKRASMVAAEDEETIEKIISLLKQHGDDIDVKIKDSASVSSFFQSLSYTNFQELADRYMEEEVPSKLPEDTAAPELVKFAFTLEFTAKVAGLANQAVNRIMGFGNQYLQDRFTQMNMAQDPVSRGEACQSVMGPD
ncbi:hypothetical protein SKAU_G00103980 [Synaphobranchus kaupii]|uniref:Apoptosis facilitator Bcl-2-like protein 14 n=1 Tax=Synaphobranchus kaupii TaxID=118154 RepID=A0A9Q1FZ49_SYNKA|nr:hypothetical protein SKAU_G00103980 [Synaphobranchus kaupii]